MQLHSLFTFQPKARAVGRGGSATSNLKRYEIRNVYRKAMAGGHPTETLEATFDVVHEDSTHLHLIEAETIFVGFQVVKTFDFLDGINASCHLRIGNTRLADAVIDLCGVPSNEKVRNVCYEFLATSGNLQASKISLNDMFEQTLHQVCEEENVPKSLLKEMRNFHCSVCPFPSDISQALTCLQKAIIKLQKESWKNDHRRMKRFEDAARQLKSLRDLIGCLVNLGVVNNNQPMEVFLDLGLRQKRKHYHGGTIFQYILQPGGSGGNFSRKGIKVAEGGNYSALVRQYRPPGNFGSSVVSQYTAARIPQCAGVRFFVGKLVEIVYLQSTPRDSSNISANDPISMDVVRTYLGHPFSFAKSVQVLVASAQGMDHESTPERFLVASKLWIEGISAEYLPQSGIALSLVRRLVKTDEQDLASDWSLLELQGACSLLQIPFLVIVQPHLLRNKGAVRLRLVSQDFIPAASSSGSSELFLPLDSLAATIQSLKNDGTNIDASDHTRTDPGSSVREQKTRDVEVDCVLIEADQYYSDPRDMPKNDPRRKPLQKAMKSATLQAEEYVSSMLEAKSHNSTGIPLFAVTDLSFFMLRDFGSELMRREEKDQSASGACAAMIEKYPNHRRTWKTLSAAIDNYMKQRHSFWSHLKSSKMDTTPPPSSSKRTISIGSVDSSTPAMVTMLLYSKADDRFDTITLNTCAHSIPEQSHRGQTSSKKR